LVEPKPDSLEILFLRLRLFHDLLCLLLKLLDCFILFSAPLITSGTFFAVFSVSVWISTLIKLSVGLVAVLVIVLLIISLWLLCALLSKIVVAGRHSIFDSLQDRRLGFQVARSNKLADIFGWKFDATHQLNHLFKKFIHLALVLRFVFDIGIHVKEWFGLFFGSRKFLKILHVWFFFADFYWLNWFSLLDRNLNWLCLSWV